MTTYARKTTPRAGKSLSVSEIKAVIRTARDDYKHQKFINRMVDLKVDFAIRNLVSDVR